MPETAAPRVRAAEEGSEEAAATTAAGLREVLSHRPSLRHALTTCFTYAGMFAYVAASPFILMDVFGVSRANFGYFFALTAAALLVAATLNRSLLKRRTPSLLILRRGVFVVFGAGLALAGAVALGVGGLAGVLLPMMAYMFGQGLVMPNATAAAMAPHGQSAGVISSLMGGLQTAAGALAGYVVGAFYDHTPLSLGVTVAAFAALALWASGVVGGRAPRREESIHSSSIHATCGA
jgi:DHA1 family bicyclomycin/chloramphenicol resistance-like MFS transporter